jgi:hypothetical protein
MRTGFNEARAFLEGERALTTNSAQGLVAQTGEHPGACQTPPHPTPLRRQTRRKKGVRSQFLGLVNGAEGDNVRALDITQ